MPISPRSFRNVVGFDDLPFNFEYLGDVRVMGAVHNPLERCGALWVQRVGLSLREAGDLFAATTSHGNILEPRPLAHIIVGGVERGASQGRP